MITMKDQFSFATKVLGFDTSSFMVSFDIKSLFTNIPLAETLEPYVENLYGN